MRRYTDEELEQKIEQVKRKTRKSKSQTVRAVNKKIEKAQEQLKQPGLSRKAKAAIAAGAAAFAGVALAALLKSAGGQKAQPRPNAQPNNPQQEDIRNVQEVQRVFNAVARSVQSNAQERGQSNESERDARAFIQAVKNLSQSYEQLRRVWGEEGRDRDRAFRGFQSDFREANRLYRNTVLMDPSLVTQDMIASRNRFLEIQNWFNRNGRIAGSSGNRSGLDFDSKPRKDILKRRIDSIVRREVAKHVCRVLDDDVRNKVRIIEQEASKLPDKTMGQKIKMKLRAIVDPTMHTKKKLAILGAILGGIALYRGQKNIRKAVGEIRQTLQANEKARENIRRNREEELRRIRQRSSEARHQMNEYFRERRARFGLNPQPSFSSHERRNGPRNFGSGPMDIDI